VTDHGFVYCVFRWLQVGDDNYVVVPGSQFVVSRTAFKDNSSYYKVVITSLLVVVAVVVVVVAVVVVVCCSENYCGQGY